MAPSIRSMLSYIGASNLLSQTPLINTPSSSITNLPFASAPSCPIDGPVSCHNNTDAGDSCCFIYPGGQLLQTQFWDSHPAVGPSDSWTLHGLWPDLCDGSFDQFCSSAPQYYNISRILQDAGQSDLLDYMNEYWLPNAGTTEHFWEHEWNKHGTCINTLSPSCYGDAYTPGLEAVDFFVRTVELFKSLDTYAALAAAGITPSRTNTYTLRELQDALSAVTGSTVWLGCQGRYLNQAWYYYNVRGSLQTGEFVPTEPSRSRGGCPSAGIRYMPK